ncbi:MAG: bifunctional UDP-N-acetylglucosamine diphosphorylase/glucosamine-1-phosphate N-acetyltransferase GlmU [Candidatus Omnitrophica bacterium]|nr:bifunctional UDP-N-acetylglucosamine diphosphorylase/glucosamine-1-phosphate N-acetyltransferase GlmU [Candidatus Omnitrophota bacterium]
MKNNLAVIILAAGRGERMKSALPKVLHPVCGRPMLSYVLDLARGLKASKVVTVLGHQHQEVKKLMAAGIKIVVQKRLLGTADAVKAARGALGNFKGALLVLYGDILLLKKETIQGLLKYHRENNLDAAILTATVEKPQGYGRILRDEYSSICGIREEKDADDYEKELKEINTGIICFNKEKLYAALGEIKADNRKKEYYLTDIIRIFYEKGYAIDGVALSDINEALGINSRQELSQADRIMRQRINEKWMQEGVSIIEPAATFISYSAKIGRDTLIYPFTVIENNVKIGKSCSIGPFAHLREGTVIADNVVVGNFLEIVRSRISSKTLIKHFGYLGDARIGRQANIGAGAVTANFDGRQKNITVIKDGAFIGSDTVMVAPVKIGKAAVTAAGAVVLKNKNVPDGQRVAGVPARVLKK